MNALQAVTILVTLIGQLIPAIGQNKTAINNIITVLGQILPEIISTFTDLITPVKNIISALKSTDGITEAQWADLDIYEQKIDAAFDQAAKDEGFEPPSG